MKNILTEALVNSATNASFIFSYTNSAKLRVGCMNSHGYERTSVQAIEDCVKLTKAYVLSE